VGRSKAGRQAIKNTGSETTMRAELAAAVGGLIGRIATDQTWQIEDNEIERLIKAAASAHTSPQIVGGQKIILGPNF
jgi:hypothetical protein